MNVRADPVKYDDFQNVNATKRPPGTTMEGMIWNGNTVLDAALHPDNTGVSKELFAKCHGIVLLSIFTVGFIFSGHNGSGVMMAKKPDGSWSAPSAVHVMGYGGGLVAGADVQDALIFIMDADTMQDFCTRPQTRLGALAAVTMGKHGRQVDSGFNADHKGTVSVYLQKGSFVGAQLEMGTLDTRDKQNQKFYGQADLKPSQILLGDAVQIPPESGIPDLHKKLRMLEAGETWLPSQADQEKSQKLLVQAEQSGELAKEEESDIVYVASTTQKTADT